MRIGTVEPCRSASVNSSPLSPGIITSTTRRSKARLAICRRASAAEAAAVTRKPLAPRKRVRSVRIRMSSSTTRRCGASSEGSAGAGRFHGFVLLVDELRGLGPLRRIDHAEEEGRHGRARVGSEPGKRGLDALLLRRGEAGGKRAPRRRRVEQALAPVLAPGPLLDQAGIDQLLQDARQALLGDLQDVEEVGDGQARDCGRRNAARGDARGRSRILPESRRGRR